MVFPTAIDSRLEPINIISSQFFPIITTEDLEDFKEERLRENEPITVDTKLDTLSVFLEYCRSEGWVVPKLPITVPDVETSKEDERRTRTVERERAMEIIDYLRKFEPASRELIVWVIMATTGMRLCSIHSLDFDDYHPPSDGENGYFELHHRPETGTRLKNGKASERQVELFSRELCEMISDYRENPNKRPDVVDDYGRRPLLTTRQGRLSESTMRTYINKWTAPCARTHECPYDGETVDDCVAANMAGNMGCPDKRSPHDVRRGYISWLREIGVPKPIVRERVDASPKVIDKHYDQTNDEQQRKVRSAVLRKFLND